MGIDITIPPEVNVVNVGDELTVDQLEAIQNASGASATNPLATIADVGSGGGGSSYNQSLNTTDTPTFVGINLPNGTSITSGSFDNGQGGYNGISLNCAVGYELNWQAGYLSSSMLDGNNIPVLRLNSSLALNGSGTSLSFPDGTYQTTAFPTFTYNGWQGALVGTSMGQSAWTNQQPVMYAIQNSGGETTVYTETDIGGSYIKFNNNYLNNGVRVDANGITFKDGSYLSTASVGGGSAEESYWYSFQPYASTAVHGYGDVLSTLANVGYNGWENIVSNGGMGKTTITVLVRTNSGAFVTNPSFYSISEINPVTAIANGYTATQAMPNVSAETYEIGSYRVLQFKAEFYTWYDAFPAFVPDLNLISDGTIYDIRIIISVKPITQFNI